jgi:hypothetical protein
MIERSFRIGSKSHLQVIVLNFGASIFFDQDAGSAVCPLCTTATPIEAAETTDEAYRTSH